MKNLEERARWLRHHCKLANKLELETPRGKLEILIYNLSNKEAIRVSVKDGAVVDISRTAPALMRPISPDWQDFEFGGF